MIGEITRFSGGFGSSYSYAITRSFRMVCAQTILDQDMEQDYWMTAAVGAMLAAAPTLQDPPPREHIAEVMTALVQQADTISALARQLGLSRRSILDCQGGEQLLQLDTLLHICRIFALAPLTVLTRGADALTTMHPPAPHSAAPPDNAAISRLR